jgi:uncharacterized damage-inducible protein DinB
MRTATISLASLCVLALAPSAAAQAPASTAVTESLKGPYGTVKGYVTRAAEQVPEALYAYKPTPDVRSLGQLFAHVADANQMFCSAVLGQPAPGGSAEKTATAKGAIQKALAESFAVCDRAFASVNDSTGAAGLTILNGMKSTKLGVLSLTTSHQFEHYGNIVTYMRLNKMVPPSSQPAGN